MPGDEKSKAEILSGTAQLDQELGDRWLASLRFNQSATERRSGVDGYAYGFAANGDTGLYQSGLQFDTDTWTGEIRLQGRLDVLGRPATLVVGVDRYEQEFFQDLSFGFLDGPGTPNFFADNFADFTPRPELVQFRDEETETQQTGGYAQFQVRPFDRLSVLLGGRYDEGEVTNRDFRAGTTSKNKNDAFTGRVGLVFDISEQVSVYGLYAESFNPVGSTDINGEVLEPETGEIFETGIKTEWLDGRLGINAAIYRLDRDKIPIPVQTPPGTPGFSISSGVQRSDGFELEINGEPLPGWNLSVAGTLLDGRFTERDDPDFGNVPSGSADWQVGLYTSYELQGGPLQGLGFGAGLRHLL